jgi:hypothetical protein
LGGPPRRERGVRVEEIPLELRELALPVCEPVLLDPQPVALLGEEPLTFGDLRRAFRELAEALLDRAGLVGYALGA